MEATRQITEEQFYLEFNPLLTENGKAYWEECEIPKEAENEDRVWVVAEEGTGQSVILSGKRAPYKIGFIVTEKPWKCDVLVNLEYDAEDH